mmetsp:Transcript_14940/g.22982  ORF Transcript_14940/g.22982 Transcript_14940/m.22982 type:complete len:264 (+) Transcript_14940:153-944(+)
MMISILVRCLLVTGCLFSLACGFCQPPAFTRAMMTAKSSSSLSIIKSKFTPFVTPESTCLPTKKTTTLLSSLSSDNDDGTSFARKPFTVLGSLWGTGGTLCLLLQAFKYNLPSALEPLRQGGMVFSPLQWSIYAATVVIFALGQGNRCLQLKFAPLVVKRACSLDDKNSNAIVHGLLAPLYVMGLFHGTKQRLIKSYSLIFGTAALQIALQKGMVLSGASQSLSILNAGFAAGFGWGIVSLACLYLSSMLTGKTPNYDAGFPE